MEDHSGDAPLFIADNLALDFINSAYGVGADARDHFISDDAVAAWLIKANALPGNLRNLSTQGLRALAVEFRDLARGLVQQRRVGGWADPSSLNDVLALRQTHAQLRWPSDSPPILERVQTYDQPASLLLPVAEALAQLLVDADMSRVRECGGDSCTLIFLDTTRSHRRRWCDMAQCGNRAKVNSFRTRRKATGA